jgi:hypothetical protein
MKLKKCSVCGKEFPLKTYHKLYKRNKKGNYVKNNFRANCRSCENRRRRESYVKNPIKGILANVRQRCKKCNIDFNISEEDVLIPKICPILEIPLKRGTKGDYDGSPTIDRLIPELGYVKGNVKVISMMANRMKTNATREQIQNFIKNINEYLGDDIV